MMTTRQSGLATSTRLRATRTMLLSTLLATINLIAIDNDSDVPGAPAGDSIIDDLGSHLWLDTLPSNAIVTINNVDQGTTPLFLPGLDNGAYTVRFSMPGYETLDRALKLPGTTALQRFTLRQTNGTVRIISTPAHAAVLFGSQLLGHTPCILTELLPGEHDLRLVEAGFQPKSVRVNVSADAPTTVNATLLPATGSLSISALPYHATIVVDGAFNGRMQPDSAEEKTTHEPLVVTGLKSGEHTVYLELHGRRSPIKRVNVSNGGQHDVRLTLWFPDVEIQTHDGQTLIGMCIESNAQGDMVIARSNGHHERIRANDIQSSTTLTVAQSLDVIKRTGK